jgi:hypothetical protein
MGLIKTGLKAAVAVKTAHVVHDRIERRQQAQWAAAGGQPAGMVPPAVAPQAAAPVAHVAPAAPAAVAAPPPASEMLAQLTQLGELRAAGVLTEAEFATQKARILNG